jgi:hypothetical protein
MELARDLLVASSDSVKQIAHRAGYALDAAFNRAFARQHGRTPAQWRMDQAAQTNQAAAPPSQTSPVKNTITICQSRRHCASEIGKDITRSSDVPSFRTYKGHAVGSAAVAARMLTDDTRDRRSVMRVHA